MEEDSGHLDKSDQMTHGQPASQQSMSPSQSFQCNHCVLLFKSKYFLLEHMKKVHGIDVDPSQNDGSSNPSESSTQPHSSTLYNNSEESFSCRHCMFTSSSWPVIIKHERTNHKVLVKGPGKGRTLKTQKLYLRGKLLNVKVPLPGNKNQHNVSRLQCKQGEVGRLNFPKSKSTSKTINIPSSSLLLENLQTQVGSSKNISKFKIAHGSSLNSSQLKLPNLSRPSRAHDVTLVSHVPFLSYDQDGGKGVSKVTEERSHTESEQKGSHCCSLCNFSATWLEDLHTHQRSEHSYLFYSMGLSLLDGTASEQRDPKPETYNEMPLTEPLDNATKKRMHDDTALSPAKKKIKTSPESTVIQSKLSGGTAFTFEVSEDEEEGDAWRTELDASGTEKDEHDQLENRESRDKHKILYRCKHCDYNHRSSRSLSTHYQRMHPYIRYDFQYIINPDDWTATFRCLECPVEFATPDDLKKHYRDHHPEAPDVFMMRSNQLDLVYKCFACPFTISNGKYLKPHYKNKHPKLKMSSPLMYCSFTAKPSKDEPSKSHLGQTSSLKNAEVVSPERSLTPCKETVHINSTPPKECSASMEVDEELYHCKHCAFSNKSVVVVLAHFQKSHPKAGLTIDDIKQESLATSREAKDETQSSPQNMVLEPFKLPEVKSPNTSLFKPDVAQDDVENMFFCQHCNYGNLTVRGVLNHQRSRHSDLNATVEQIHFHTAEVHSQSKVSHSTPLQKDLAQEHVIKPFKLPEVKSPNTSPPISNVSQADESLYFCQFCGYCNPTVRGVMNHQKLRHSTRKSTAERIIKHTAAIRSNPKVRGVLSHQKLRHSTRKSTAKRIIKHTAAIRSNLKLRGVLNHQKLRQSHRKVTANKVIKHTAEAHVQSEKLQSTGFDSSNSSLKSTVENEIADLFFCQYCNYGNPRAIGVLNHQKLRHRCLQTSTSQILQYTSELRSQKDKPQSAEFDSSLLTSDIGNEAGNLFFCQFCNYGHPSMRGMLNHQKRRHSELQTTPGDIFRHTAEVGGQTEESKKSKGVNLTKSSHILPLPLVTEEAVLFCQLCNYSNRTMRVVVEHQRKRHPDLKATAKQILEYTAMILSQTSKSPNCSFLTSDVVQEELEKFFCQYCDYNNPTVRGIFNHQSKMHCDLETNAAQILRHTVVVREQTKKSQPKAVNSPNSPHLLSHPLLKDEVEHVFFCQLCNYSSSTVMGVLNHKRKRHLDMKPTAKQILEYTATVLGQMSKSHPVRRNSLNSSQEEERKLFYCQHCNYDNPTVRGVLNHQKLRHSDLKGTADQVVRYTAIVPGPNKKSTMQQPNRSSMKASQSRKQKAALLRSLKCRKCSYTTPHIYLLKRHLRNNHQEKAPITTIIHWAYQDGHLQEGYHCEWCACSHTDAKGLLRHYRQRHPDKKTGLESIILRLHAGPKTSRSKKTKPNPEHNEKHDQIILRFGDVPKTTSSFQTGGGDTQVYPCRACPFKATSMGGISSHYHAVHPWSVKEDGSVLDVISSRQTQEPEVHEQLDVHETLSSSETYRCPVCSGEFNTLHGMLTHCGKKHPEYDTSTYEREPEAEPSTSEGTLVFKCSICPYVNSHAHGVLTHCQMRHPAVKARTERLEQEIVHFTDPNECLKVRSGKRMGLAGFRCNMCPVIHAKFKKLKAHYEMDHKRSAANIFKPALKQSAAIKKQLLSKYRGSQTSIAQAAILKNGKSIVKCHLCKYLCATKKGLACHLRINHSTVAPIEGKEFSYKCALCSYTTLICKYLAAHYRRQHGNAAFTNHFVPAFRPHRVLPYSPDHKASLSQETKSPGEKISCSRCFFQCLSEKGLVSHYAICHPGVSPSKHKSSKLSPNNTVQSPPKPRNHPQQHKPVCKLFDPQCEKGKALLPVKCKKCVKLSFNSNLLLSIHYTNFHNEDFTQDFTILSKTSEDDTEFYRCGYCNLQIQGSADLCSHLDHHNEEFQKLTNGQKRKQRLSDPPPKTKPVKERQELPEVLTAEESDSHWIVTQVESVTTGMGPLVSPSPVPSTTEPEGGSVGEECSHCGRTFMSLKGLRSHERSHAATAALKRLDNVPHQQKQMFDRHIRHRPGTTRPFHCGLCRYRTTILSLLKNHLLKVHGAQDPSKNLPSSVTGSENKEHTLRAAEETQNLLEPQEGNQMSDDSEESDLTEKPVYSEPPDVQRQLNHYRQVAQAKSSSSPPSPQTTSTTQDGLLVCEFCIYTSTHIKSMRRHYINRHNGKRLVRCKDCSFFTGFRKKLDMHIETAHAGSPTEAPKELHCPLCLYHTKNKNRMIDHIVLHREQPVAPIEVRRPTLSRYLEGIVFRCHKCTFTSSSDKKLLLHMLKHDDIKPYKCRLCYFDCTQLSELEAHLCDKHQVVRNHELVGQVHLEELETRLSRVNGEGEQFMDCEETQGQQDEVNKDGNKEVAENTAQNSEFQDFSNDENQEGQYKQSHEKVEEHLMDCEEENQEPGEMDIEEQNIQYHEMPVLKDEACNYHKMPVLENEEGKEEMHSNHGATQENEEEAVKTDRLKPECDNKPEQGSEQDEKYEENPKSGEKQDHEVEENNKENGNISSPKDAATTLKMIPVTRNEKALSCELCGRTLMNSTDLERHVMRHGL